MTWTQKLFAKWGHGPRTPYRRTRLVLEPMEVRDVPAVFLQGYTFVDGNGDGMFGAGDDAKPGAQVQLRTLDGQVLQTATTGADGYYRFDAVEPGTYKLVELPPAGFTTAAAEAKTAFSTATVNADNSIQVTVPEEIRVVRQPGLDGVNSAYVLDTPTIDGPFNDSTAQLNSINAHQYELRLGGPEGTRILSFCVDLFHANPADYTVTPSATPDSPVPTFNLERIGYLYNTYGTEELSATDGTALQLAIYELLYDVTPDFDSGSFRLLGGTDPEAREMAEDFIAQSAGKDQRAAFLNVKYAGSGSQGMLATEQYNFGNVKTPTPPPPNPCPPKPCECPGHNGSDGKGSNGSNGKGSDGKGSNGSGGKGSHDRDDRGDGNGSDGKGSNGKGSDGKGSSGKGSSDKGSSDRDDRCYVNGSGSNGKGSNGSDDRGDDYDRGSNGKGSDGKGSYDRDDRCDNNGSDGKGSNGSDGKGSYDKGDKYDKDDKDDKDDKGSDDRDGKGGYDRNKKGRPSRC